MSEHARLSPSGSERWLRCAASVSMTEALQDQESSAAAEGTRAHAAMEDALRNYLALGDEAVDRRLCDDEEMFDHVVAVVAYVIERFESFPGDDVKMFVEVKVNLHYMTNRDDLWGKADVIIISTTHLEVFDLKYGAGIFVEADTTQNRIYLLGAMSMEMRKSKGDVPWETVTGTIMQPRYADKEGNTVRGTSFDPNDLIAWKDDVLLPGAELTDRPGAPIAGPKQCMFCAAKSTCEAVANKVNDLCSVFQPVDSFGIGIKEMTPADPDTMDVDRLIEVHDNIPFIEGYLKAVSAKIRTMLEARDPALEGKLKLIRSRRTNKWSKDDDEILEVLTTAPGIIKKSDLTKTVLLTAPQALKLKLKPAQKKKLQGFVTKSEGSLSIVPWSDERANEFPPIPFEAVDELAPEGHSDSFDFL